MQLLKAKAGFRCEQGCEKNSEVPTFDAVFMAGSSAPLQTSADSHNNPGRFQVLRCTHTSLPLLTSPPRLRRPALRGEKFISCYSPPSPRGQGGCSAGSTFSGTPTISCSYIQGCPVLETLSGIACKGARQKPRHLQDEQGFSSSMSWLRSGSLRQKADIIHVTEHNCAFQSL